MSVHEDILKAIAEWYGRSEEALARGSSNAGISVHGIRAGARIGREMAAAIRRVLDSYDSPGAFQRDWKWVRLLVPLQMRLMVEQVLWDKGIGWRKLVTGFGPVRTGKSIRAKRF